MSEEAKLVFLLWNETQIPLSPRSPIMRDTGADTEVAAADLNDEELLDAIVHQYEYIEHVIDNPRDKEELAWENAVYFVLETELDKRDPSLEKRVRLAKEKVAEAIAAMREERDAEKT